LFGWSAAVTAFLNVHTVMAKQPQQERIPA
jgi:hypothetical protein